MDTKQVRNHHTYRHHRKTWSEPARPSISFSVGSQNQQLEESDNQFDAIRREAAECTLQEKSIEKAIEQTSNNLNHLQNLIQNLQQQSKKEQMQIDSLLLQQRKLISIIRKIEQLGQASSDKDLLQSNKLKLDMIRDQIRIRHQKAMTTQDRQFEKIQDQFESQITKMTQLIKDKQAVRQKRRKILAPIRSE